MCVITLVTSLLEDSTQNWSAKLKPWRATVSHTLNPSVTKVVIWENTAEVDSGLTSGEFSYTNHFGDRLVGGIGGSGSPGL